MSVMYIAVPLALALAAAAIVAFVRATAAGQFDDLETPALRVLHDDVPTRILAPPRPPGTIPGIDPRGDG